MEQHLEIVDYEIKQFDIFTFQTSTNYKENLKAVVPITSFVFDNSTNGGAHPFRIQSSAGLSGTPYTTGQSGSGTAVLYWTVPMDAPGTLYYQCTIHSQMNGTITVVS